MNNRRGALKTLISLGVAAPLSSSAAMLRKNAGEESKINNNDNAALKTHVTSEKLDALRERISGPNQFPPSFNPMAGNPLKTRADVTKAIHDLYLPLTPFYSKGGARVRLDMAGSMFDRTSADLEGFARPLWGLAPLAKGGGADFVDWDLFRRGLANGTNPNHSEYWGACTDRDQRLVELSAIGFALSLIPNILWKPQSASSKRNIAAYLQHAYSRTFGENNWLYFRIMIGMGLKAIGESVDETLKVEYEQKIDALYLDKGWYRDGPFRRADYYVPFAFHFYGLLYSSLANDKSRKQLLQQRASALTPEFIHWFAEDGAALPFGRSLTYRFACASYWSALAFADVPTLPWGQIKGLVLRHLRWWSTQPIAHRDGILSLGYTYPNQHIVEHYSSACSPYWAFKVFAFMALPENHPFWTSKEEELPKFDQPASLSNPGMVIFHPPGDAIALSSGQEEHRTWLRLATEKYAKFAYSAHFGFGVETVLGQFNSAGLDNTLGFSTDGFHFRVRENNEKVKIANEVLYAQWNADEDISVETWLLPASPWHIRIHRIRSKKICKTIEGGFAAARSESLETNQSEVVEGSAFFHTRHDFSGIRDLGSSIKRTARVIETIPNSNLINPYTNIPQLLCTIPVGETILISAILAIGNQAHGKAAWDKTPVAPSIKELEGIIKQHGVDVTVAKI